MLTKITSQHMGLNLVLDGLAQINYLVGVNGSGKTRLMQSIKSRMTLYVDQLREPKPDDAVAVTFFSNDADVYQIIKDGSIANNPFDLDLFMVQGEKRTALGLGDDFKNHPLTQKIIALFYPGKNFEIQMRGDNEISFKESAISNSVWIPLDSLAAGFQSLFKLWNNTCQNKFPKGRGLYLLCLDEVDRHLHPSLAKKLPSVLNELIVEIEKLAVKNSNGFEGAKVQIFITTHSPFTVRGALEHEGHKIFHIEKGELNHSFDRTELIKRSGIPFDDVLADLGFKMQDLYYPEALICVEGPVDALYLQFWLEKFIEEMKLSKDTFIKGVHYDFFEFGGALAAHLTLSSNVDIDLHEGLDKENIVNLFSLNRKVFLMVDNDANNAFEKTKRRLQNLIDKEKHRGCVFFRSDKYITIECLLTESTKHSENKSSKVSAAVANLKYWRKNSKSLSDFNPEVYTLMHALYGFLSAAVYSSAELKTQA